MQTSYGGIRYVKWSVTGFNLQHPLPHPPNPPPPPPSPTFWQNMNKWPEMITSD